MVSLQARLAVMGIMLVGVTFGLLYPEVCTSPDFAVGMNTFSLALFVLCTLESKEYDGAHANERHPILWFLSNRAVGALILLSLTLFSVYTNLQMIQKAR